MTSADAAPATPSFFFGSMTMGAWRSWEGRGGFEGKLFLVGWRRVASCAGALRGRPPRPRLGIISISGRER